MSKTIDRTSPAIAGILAELRAVETRTNSEDAQTNSVSCCTGDRRGYQWHQRNHVPACEASKEAAAAYMREYSARNGGWAGRVQRERARKARAR